MRTATHYCDALALQLPDSLDEGGATDLVLDHEFGFGAEDFPNGPVSLADVPNDILGHTLTEFTNGAPPAFAAEVEVFTNSGLSN